MRGSSRPNSLAVSGDFGGPGCCRARWEIYRQGARGWKDAQKQAREPQGHSPIRGASPCRGGGRGQLSGLRRVRPGVGHENVGTAIERISFPGVDSSHLHLLNRSIAADRWWIAAPVASIQPKFQCSLVEPGFRSSGSALGRLIDAFLTLHSHVSARYASIEEASGWLDGFEPDAGQASLGFEVSKSNGESA